MFTSLVCLSPVVVGIVGTDSLAWEFKPGLASICPGTCRDDPYLHLPGVVDLMMMMQAVVVVVVVVVLLHRRLLHQTSARELE